MRKTRCSANVSAWPGRSASSTSSPPRPTNGKNSTPTTAAWPMPRRCSMPPRAHWTALEDEEGNARSRTDRALVSSCNTRNIWSLISRALTEVLASSLAQVEDSVHSLRTYLRRTELDPERLAELDERMTLWMSLARRYKRPPEELAATAGRLERRVGPARCRRRSGRPGSGRTKRPKPPTWKRRRPFPRRAARPPRNWPRPSPRPCRAWACRAASLK